jgi:hypothetical protein
LTSGALAVGLNGFFGSVWGQNRSSSRQPKLLDAKTKAELRNQKTDTLVPFGFGFGVKCAHPKGLNSLLAKKELYCFPYSKSLC